MKVLGGNVQKLIVEITVDEFTMLTGQGVFDPDNYRRGGERLNDLIGKDFDMKQTVENQRNAQAAWESRDRVKSCLEYTIKSLDNIYFPIKPTHKPKEKK